jgi:hypothetical protein
MVGATVANLSHWIGACFLQQSESNLEQSFGCVLPSVVERHHTDFLPFLPGWITIRPLGALSIPGTESITTRCHCGVPGPDASAGSAVTGYLLSIKNGMSEWDPMLVQHCNGGYDSVRYARARWVGGGHVKTRLSKGIHIYERRRAISRTTGR